MVFERMMRSISQKKKLELLVVALSLFIYVMFHLPNISNGAWENYDSWRQGDTYSVALNYYQYDMNPLRPQFNYDGVSDIVIQLELQIVPYLSAICFKILGYPTPAIPRLIGLFLFCGSAVFIYLTAKRFVSALSAFAAFVLYLILPINLLYSRAIMPESCALFFLTAAIWLLLRWSLDDAPLAIWLSALCTALAIIEKTPTIFVGFLCIAVLVWKLGNKTLKSIEFYGFGVISLGLPLVYILYSSAVATVCYVDGIATKHILTKQIFSIFTPEAINFFRRDLPVYFGVIVLIAAVFGLLRCFNKERRFLAVLALSFLFELVTIVAIIKFNYYLIFISPVVSLLVAVFFDDLAKWAKPVALCVGAAVIVLTGFQAVSLYREQVSENYEIYAISMFIQENTFPEDTIALSNECPIFHNVANRHGYRAGINGLDPREEVDFYISQGVDYFVVLYNSVMYDTNGEYLQYLNDNFPVHAQIAPCTIYDLKKD